MQSGTPTTRLADRCAGRVQQHLLWLLLACYASATLWPAPGLAIRDWLSAESFAGDVPLVPLLLLAVMLFSAALMTDVMHIRTVFQQPVVLVVALAAVWAGPALLVVIAGWLVPLLVDGEATAGLLVGLALVATMPVANSSIGWVQNADGNLALGLALVVLSISLSPWATPQLLQLLGSSLSPEEQQYCEALVTQFSGLFFIVWVILPTASGLACRYLLGASRIATAAGWISLTSAAALLTLNYINSALALPNVFQQPAAGLLFTTALLATSLSVVGLMIGWLLARWMRLPTGTRSTLMFGLSMKHTGLALILAGAVLVNQPLAILLIVLATIVQHLLAGVVQWWQRKEWSSAVVE